MDEAARKKALRNLSYGLHIMTVVDGDEKAGATVTWLSQSSFQPPLVMTALKKDSRLRQLVDKVGKFAVSTLGEGQKDIAAGWFKPKEDAFDGLEAAPETGFPIVKEAPTFFEAECVSKIDHGDHTIYVAEVKNAGINNGDLKALDLASTGWSYGG